MKKPVKHGRSGVFTERAAVILASDWIVTWEEKTKTVSRTAISLVLRSAPKKDEYICIGILIYLTFVEVLNTILQLLIVESKNSNE